MNIDKFSRDPDSLFVALNLQQDALEAVSLILTAACDLNDGPALNSDEAISLKARHRDVLWQACTAALQVCRNTPQRILNALQPDKVPPG